MWKWWRTCHKRRRTRFCMFCRGMNSFAMVKNKKSGKWYNCELGFHINCGGRQSHLITFIRSKLWKWNKVCRKPARIAHRVNRVGVWKQKNYLSKHQVIAIKSGFEDMLHGGRVHKMHKGSIGSRSCLL